MNSIPSSNKTRTLTPHPQVKHRKQSLDYAVPSRPKTTIIPAHTRINVRNAHHKQRFSLPPSIREEEEDDMSMNEPIIIRNNVCQHDDEDEIPLAFLAYRKGYMVPENNNTIPIIQPSNNYRRKQNLSQQYPNYYGSPTGFTLPVPNNKLYHPHITQQQQPHFYQMSDLTYSPSSSNSSLSSVERPPLSPQRKRSTSSSKSYRRESSHI